MIAFQRTLIDFDPLFFLKYFLKKNGFSKKQDGFFYKFFNPPGSRDLIITKIYLFCCPGLPKTPKTINNKMLLFEDKMVLLVNNMELYADKTVLLVNKTLLLVNKTVLLINKMVLYADKMLLIVNKTVLLVNKMILLVNKIVLTVIKMHLPKIH